jgi:shikimate kinase
MSATLRQVVLIGLPGSGKSTVGRMLAGRLSWDFVDLDAAIVDRAGAPIDRIFADAGEERFRQLEALETAELRNRDRLVVAPGGGWVTRPETVALLPSARLAYLQVSAETAARRVSGSGVARPLLAGPEKTARMAELLSEREALYGTADLTVDAELIVEKVVTLLERWLVTGVRGP